MKHNYILVYTSKSIIFKLVYIQWAFCGGSLLFEYKRSNRNDPEADSSEGSRVAFWDTKGANEVQLVILYNINDIDLLC